MDPHGPIAGRFPLVARVRPVCLPLTARVDKLRELADAAEREAYQGLASSVFNQAALLASDLDLPELARHWCRRHAAAYLRTCPLGGMDAIRGLEPLVNLARLHIRAGRSDQGHRLLLALYDAVTGRTGAVLESITVPADLTATDADRQEVRQWLWRVIIADGTRALTTDGRWQDALTHLQQHNGVGQRMLDGRQVAVLARATIGDHRGARQLLAGTTPGDPWENAVTACLTTLCRPLGHRPPDPEIDTLLDRCRLHFQTDLVVFHTRLMLAIVDAAGHTDHPGVRAAAAEQADQIVETGDGYAARDVLAHDGCISLLKEQQAQRLAQTVDACALGRRAISPVLRADLAVAMDASEAVITRALNGQSATTGPAR